jgi:hypothetical protein
MFAVKTNHHNQQSSSKDNKNKVVMLRACLTNLTNKQHQLQLGRENLSDNLSLTIVEKKSFDSLYVIPTCNRGCLFYAGEYANGLLQFYFLFTILNLIHENNICDDKSFIICYLEDFYKQVSY